MLPQFKPVVAISATSVGTSGGTIASSAIDTVGFDFCSLDIWGSTQAATTQAAGPSVLKIQESDTTVVSTFADIVGFRGGSATATNVDFIVGIGSSTLTNSYKFNIDLRARKRYLTVAITAASAQSFYAAANLGRAEQSPSTATKAGVLNLVEG